LDRVEHDVPITYEAFIRQLPPELETLQSLLDYGTGGGDSGHPQSRKKFWTPTIAPAAGAGDSGGGVASGADAVSASGLQVF